MTVCPPGASPQIVLSDLGLTVSREYLLAYLKCTGRYRLLAERVLHRRALIGPPEAWESGPEPIDPGPLLAAFQKDNGLLTEEHVHAAVRDLGLTLAEVRVHLIGRARHDGIVIEALARRGCSDREVLLELLFDEEYRVRLVQASVWQRIATQVGILAADDAEQFRDRARRRLLGMVELGDWASYCAGLERLGMDRAAVEAFVDSVAKVECYKERSRWPGRSSCSPPAR